MHRFLVWSLGTDLKKSFCLADLRWSPPPQKKTYRINSPPQIPCPHNTVSFFMHSLFWHRKSNKARLYHLQIEGDIDLQPYTLAIPTAKIKSVPQLTIHATREKISFVSKWFPELLCNDLVVHEHTSGRTVLRKPDAERVAAGASWRGTSAGAAPGPCDTYVTVLQPAHSAKGRSGPAYPTGVSPPPPPPASLPSYLSDQFSSRCVCLPRSGSRGVTPIRRLS